MMVSFNGRKRTLMHPPRTLKRFLRVFLPLSLVLAVALAVHARVELELLRTQTFAREELAVDLGAGALHSGIAAIASDIEYLANSMELRQLVVDDSPLNLARLATELSSFSLSKRVYDQLRWIDETGRERVRVDRAGQGVRIVPVEALQDKASRYYFVDAMRLAPGELYVSPLDLNVENGRIDVPHKPMLRLATPVSDGAGRARGIVSATTWPVTC